MIDWISGGLVLAGASLALLAGVGVVRMPDVFTRMQASTKASTLGLGCPAAMAGRGPSRCAGGDPSPSLGSRSPLPAGDAGYALPITDVGAKLARDSSGRSSASAFVLCTRAL